MLFTYILVVGLFINAFTFSGLMMIIGIELFFSGSLIYLMEELSDNADKIFGKENLSLNCSSEVNET